MAFDHNRPDVALPGVNRTFEVIAARHIPAPPETVYAVFADYRHAHPRILPPSIFVGLEVQEGGYGAGTSIIVRTRVAGRVRALHGIVTEPRPGRLLVESYPEDRTVTAFDVAPEAEGSACKVTIWTLFRRRWGPLGWLEERLVRRILQAVYVDELERVAAYVAAGSEREGSAQASD